MTSEEEEEGTPRTMHIISPYFMVGQMRGDDDNVDILMGIMNHDSESYIPEPQEQFHGQQEQLICKMMMKDGDHHICL